MGESLASMHLTEGWYLEFSLRKLNIKEQPNLKMETETKHNSL